MSSRAGAAALLRLAFVALAQACYVPIPDVWHSDVPERECEQHADCYLGDGYRCATCSDSGICMYGGETGEECGAHGVCVDWRCIEVR